MPVDTPPRRVGRYELSTKIASGGMAVVYLGRSVGSEGFSRVVAIKRMHSHMVEDAKFRAMFIDEARLAAQIHHSNVAQIIDLVSDGEDLLLVMAYVHGPTVAALLHGSMGPFPPAVAVRIALDALVGLHAAHQATGANGAALGIVHRDVSPQNLLVSTEGTTIVVDFGVAKAVERLQTTREGELKGKVRYMAPEQIRQGVLGPWTDVYSLGVVLWEMLTGTRLFPGSNGAALMSQVLDGSVPRPSTLAKAVPLALEEVVMRAVRRDPASRFPSARAMADALEALGMAASPRDVAQLVLERAQPMLQEREETLSLVRNGGVPVSGPGEESTASGRRIAGGGRAARGVAVPDGARTGRRRILALVGLLALLAVCVVAVAGLRQPTSGGAAAPGPSEPATAPPPPPASVATALDAPVEPTPSVSPPTTIARPSPPRLPRAPAAAAPRQTRPVVDCAKNPRILGPDGLWQVRRECLGQ